jgi:uncharacterized protein Smg (DUF494 family)
MEPRLNQLLAQLRRRFPRNDSVAEVEAWLSSQGYDGGQIGTIVSAWLSDIRGVGAMGDHVAAEDWAIRVQGPHERGRFTTEAWGYLIGLRASGLLGPQELEFVIDRLLSQVDGRIGVEDARSATDNGYGDGFGPLGEPTMVH